MNVYVEHKTRLSTAGLQEANDKWYTPKCKKSDFETDGKDRYLEHFLWFDGLSGIIKE